MTMIPLTQEATYWTVASVDGNGTKTYSAATLVPCRWVEKDGIVRNENGEDQKTEFRLYAETEIPKRSLVVFTDASELPSPPDTAREVIELKNNPSMTSLKLHLL